MVTLTLPPDGQIALMRESAILGIEPAFAWSATIQARTVTLVGGRPLIVLDTEDNVTAVLHALLGGGAAVIVPRPTAAAATDSTEEDSDG